MKRRTYLAAATAAMSLLTGVAAGQHQHAGDIVIGHTPAGALAVEADFNEVHLLAPIGANPFGLNGWEGDEPGFEGLEADEPAEEFYVLAPGAKVWFVAGVFSPALKANPLTDNLPADTMQVRLTADDGDLHTHLSWFLDADDPAFDPLQTTWQVTFSLEDRGTTQYATAGPFTLQFAIPEPGSLALLGTGALALVWRRLRQPMKTKFGSFVVGAVCVTASSAAYGQHMGDVWIGRSGSGQLVVSTNGFVPAENYRTLSPSSGVLKGWTDISPGFDRAIDSGGGVLPLESGCNIWLELVAVDPAFRLITDSYEVVDDPGESWELGGYLLHRHPIAWQIQNPHPQYDPNQCVWHATFFLRDSGSTGYAPSQPLMFKFTNVALTPATGDFDGDLDADLADYAAFDECLAGPGVTPAPDDPAVTTCEVRCLNAFDFNTDHDVDLGDFASLQIVLGQ